MKIALIGYGKMGREVENVLSLGKHTIISISFRNERGTLDREGIKKADVAIDFTSAEIVATTIQEVLSLGTNMVVGTTGWYAQLPKVRQMATRYKRGLIYGSNFSIGANIFFEIVSHASKLLGLFKDYDVAGLEMHHTGKKDSPSGTAKKLADIIMGHIPSKKTLQTESLSRQIKEDELHFVSLRIGRYFGYHEIFFDSSADEIRLSHMAHSRQGFAKGAVFAAEFIKGKKGVFSFEDVFKKEVKK